MNTEHAINHQYLDDTIKKTMTKHNIPGAVVGILYHGQELTAGYGVTSIENPLPITDETLFQIASITKTYTGTVVMKLVEEGKLDLNAKVRDYLPGFKVSDETASSRATILHLLTHTAGWEGDVFTDTGPGDDALVKYVDGMADLEQISPVGEVYSYSNSSFIVLGRIIEKVTGTSYREVVEESIFDPLGLTSSCFELNDIITRRFAVGHLPTDEGLTVLRPWYRPRSSYPAGGIMCSIQDLMKCARFHLGDGSIDSKTRLLSPSSIQLMQTPQHTIWNNRSICLPWEMVKTNGVRILSHGGAINGQMSILILVPEKEFAMAVISNAEHGGLVIQEAIRWAYKQYLDLEIPPPHPIDTTEDNLAVYAGTYIRPHVEFSIDLQDGILTGRQTSHRDELEEPDPPPMPLALCEPDRLIVTDGPVKNVTIELLRKQDGSLGWLRFGGRIHAHQL